jgi:hypothetical protein
MRALFSIVILCGTAAAQPNVKLPTLKEALAGDMVAKVKVRWSKFVDGKRATVTIQGGEAERLEPWLSDKPGPLKYDLTKNRALEKALKSAKLPGPQRQLSEVTTDRSLELLADGPKDWEVIGRWSMPEKAWEKKYPGLYELLEPMFKQQMDTFGTMPGPAK